MTQQEDGTDPAIELERAKRARAFLACAEELVRLLGIEPPERDPAATDRRRARQLAQALRRPLRQSARLPETLFAPLMAASVHDPDPSFCGWFVEPALHTFGRRRVQERLVEYLRSGTDAQRAGATRAWYWAHMPLNERRSPAYAPDGTRDPALDDTEAAREAWLEASMTVYGDSDDTWLRYAVVRMLPVRRSSYPERLHPLFDRTVRVAREDPDEDNRRWARFVEGAGP